MDAFLQDVLIYAVLGWIAYVLLNNSGGGGKRRRLPLGA